METVQLNGQPYRLGIDKAITIGFNMKCRYVIHTTQIFNGKNGFYSMGKDGLKVSVQESKLNKYYIDTVENRKIVKAICDQKNKM